MSDWWPRAASRSPFKLFICYRRGKNEFAVTYVEERLKEAFGSDNVFRDVSSIPAGAHWPSVLEAQVNACDVLLVLMEEDWLTLQGPDGKRRIDADDDFVRFEIEKALARPIPLIPVLVGRAVMPERNALPESIQALRDYQARPLGSNSVRDDTTKLIDSLRTTAENLAPLMKEGDDLFTFIEAGDWLDAAKRRTSNRPPAELENTAQYRKLEQLRSCAGELAEAVFAIERQDFTRANEVLTRLTEAEAPPIVRASVRLTQLAERLKDARPSDGYDLEQEFLAAIQSCPTAGGKIPAEREARELLQQRLKESEYQTAVRLYEAARFEDARRQLALLGDYRDSARLAERCTTWSRAIDAMRAYRWDEARRAVVALLARSEPGAIVTKTEEVRARAVQKLCLSASRIAPALEQLAAGGPVAESYVLGEDGPSPYHVLQLTPRATKDECNALGFELQSQPGGMSDERRASWDALRIIERRLLADFSVYVVRDPARVRNVCAQYFRFAAEESAAAIIERIQAATRVAEDAAATSGRSLLDRIATDLGEDGGVLYAITRNYDAAITSFLERARHSPADGTALHHLGLAAYARARSDPDADTPVEAYECVVAAWGGIFADDHFWHGWWAQRRRAYPVTEEQIQGARQTLQRACLEELDAAAELGPGIGDAFRVELNAARAVAALGGIPLGSSATARAVLGPRGAAALRIEQDVANWIAGFRAAEISGATVQRDVCVAFSSLAPAQMLVNDGRFEEAMALLARPAEPIDARFAGCNPGFARRGRDVCHAVRRMLLQRACTQLALAAVSETPSNIEKAIGYWNQALDAAARTEREAMLAEIRDVLIGRYHALRNPDREPDDLIGALNDAVKLLQDGCDQRWDDADGTLSQALSEALLDRATYLSNKYDMEKEARQDAIRAFGLTPTSLRAFHVYCVASLHYARELYRDGQQDLARALLADVEDRLGDAKQMFPGNADLEDDARSANQVREMVYGTGSSLDRALEAIRRSTQGVSGSDADGRLAQAIVLESQADFPGAVQLYWGLVQENPGQHGLQGKLAWCYRMWLIQLLEHNEFDEYRRVSAEASERCPGSAALADLMSDEPSQQGN